MLKPPISLPVTFQEQHNTPLNWGWAAHHYHQPRVAPPDLDEAYHEAWLDGWDMAQETQPAYLRTLAMADMVVKPTHT